MNLWSRVLALLIGSLAWWVPGALAQSPFAVPEPGQSRVNVEVLKSAESAAPGEWIVVGVVLDMEPGWHVHTNNPPDMPSFVPVRTELAQLKVDGATPAPIQWPPIHEIEVDFTGEGPQLYPVFEGRAVIYLPLRVHDDATGQVQVSFELVFQACNDTMCDPPEYRPQYLAIPVRSREGEGSTAPTTLPKDFEGFDFDRLAPVESSTSEPVGAAGSNFFGLTIPRGMIALALFGILGGLVLNLTPCVLPVIPLKVMALSKHADSPGRTFALGAWMALGVVGFWVGIGLPVAFLNSVTDPSQIFGVWWVTLGIGLVIAVMGVGIMGLFEIRLPDGVYAINPRADNAWGSFLFGVMTAVLGLPCFGFVAGALLAGSATMPPIEVLVIFGAIGVGMAAPYLLLSLKPQWVEKLPRTGPASDLVKQVMGLLMLAAAAYFIGSGVMALVKADPVKAAGLPVWAKVAHWWAVAAGASAAGVWLAWRTIRITRTEQTGRRVFFSLIGLVLGGGAVAFAAGRTNKAMHDIWVPYTPEVVDQALSQGRVVVLDFTADWCLNCQALKATVLDRDPVKAALASPKVVPVIADLTSREAPGWDKLRQLGQTGIPLLVIDGPGLTEPWMQNAYTSSQVMEALTKASGK